MRKTIFILTLLCWRCRGRRWPARSASATATRRWRLRPTSASSRCWSSSPACWRLRVVLHLPDAARHGASQRRRGSLNAELPGAAGRGVHPRRRIDQMLVLVHWLMLVLFVGWGAFFLFVLVRFRKGANPKASYAGAKGKIREGHRGRGRADRSAAAGVLRDSGLGQARQGVSGRERSGRRARRRRAVRVERSLSGTGRKVRPHRHQTGDAPTTRSASTQGSERQGRHHHDQSVEPAGRSARCWCTSRPRT